MKSVAIVSALITLLLAGNGEAAAGAPAEPGGDAVHGRQVFARCAACHDLNTGATVLGPSLKGIVGRPAGAIAGYPYSPALRGADLVWSPANLDAYIASPTRLVPGTQMAFAGLPDAADRADLIAWLQTAAH
jgi:cytochrome c